MDGRAPRSKTDARAAVRARRRARTADERTAAARGVARSALGLLDGLTGEVRVVAAYASTPTEPGTAALRTALAARGTTVLLPVVVPGGAAPLAWVEDGGAGAGGRRSAGAIPPADESQEADESWRTIDDADVVLLPALAVTASGHRLGQGGGHYDRTLASLVVPGEPPGPTGRGPSSRAGSGASRAPRPLLVAVVHDDELLGHGAWPVEPHDVPVHAVVTPTRWQVLP